MRRPNSRLRISTEMKYRCLVFDHDDTTVNSTATIHHPCFERFLEEYYPGRHCSLEEYFIKNFAPGFLPMCREEYGMDDRMLELETRYWQEYVRSRIPDAYPGIRQIMERQKAQGGYTAVISHSFRENILRDYAWNGLPEPDLIFGWEMPPEQRKPSPWPLREVLKQLSLQPEEALVIDDLKPGYDMAHACGVPMRQNSNLYFKKVSELENYLFGTEEKGGV